MIPFLTASQIELTDDMQIVHGKPPVTHPGESDWTQIDEWKYQRQERARARAEYREEWEK